jgi:hypothetical protein
VSPVVWGDCWAVAADAIKASTAATGKIILRMKTSHKYPLLSEHESRFKSRTLRLDDNVGSSRTRSYHSALIPGTRCRLK